MASIRRGGFVSVHGLPEIFTAGCVDQTSTDYARIGSSRQAVLLAEREKHELAPGQLQPAASRELM